MNRPAVKFDPAAFWGGVVEKVRADARARHAAEARRRRRRAFLVRFAAVLGAAAAAAGLGLAASRLLR